MEHICWLNAFKSFYQRASNHHAAARYAGDKDELLKQLFLLTNFSIEFNRKISCEKQPFNYPVHIWQQHDGLRPVCYLIRSFAKILSSRL